MKTELRTALDDILPVDDAVWDAFEPLVSHRIVPRKENVVTEGKTSSWVSFVVSGSFRFYSLTEDGDETVNGFAITGDFVASMRSLVDAEPSVFSIEALENSEVLQFDWTKVKESDYHRRLIELVSRDLFKALERRQQEFQSCTPEERYLNFLDRSPEMNAQIADLHIASYLGITPVHLSRIRKKLKENVSS